MFLQILRFALPSSSTGSSPAFRALRTEVESAGALFQYIGKSTQTRVAPLPKVRDEVTWMIGWSDGSELVERPHLERSFADVTKNLESSLLVEVKTGDDHNLLAALRAPVCEVVAMKMKSDAPIREKPLSQSMHKTFTDCYRQQGFAGGGWGYAVNTNLVEGESNVFPGCQGTRRVEEQMLAIYLLGWESIELHESANKTAVFAEEMEKLGPWIHADSGAWYVSLSKD
ncbi:hypothetical protein HJFPF1_00115 [Paramyrothecium foliicola]|nr:hypothetical protein HJFPF1_00115 [Paramyrothecium foliicola]